MLSHKLLKRWITESKEREMPLLSALLSPSEAILNAAHQGLSILQWTCDIDSDVFRVPHILNMSFGCTIGWGERGLIKSQERSEKSTFSVWVDKLGSSAALNQMSGKFPSVQLLWPENHQLKLDSYVNCVSAAFVCWRQLLGWLLLFWQCVLMPEWPGAGELIIVFTKALYAMSWGAQRACVQNK